VKLLDSEIARRAKTEVDPRRLMTIPGIGPMTATALAALASPPVVFRKGRDFAAPALRNPKRSFCARANALAKINRRQTEAGGHLEDGGSNLAAAADHRGQCRRLSSHKARGATGFMADTDAGAQAQNAGHHRACQQNGADRLGADGEERDL
jgi:Transposase IS116/IS110/IS902 family